MKIERKNIIFFVAIHFWVKPCIYTTMEKLLNLAYPIWRLNNFVSDIRLINFVYIQVTGIANPIYATWDQKKELKVWLYHTV